MHKKAKLSVGIIDLNINNLFSIYQSCLKAGKKGQKERREVNKLKKNKVVTENWKEGKGRGI